MQASIRKNYLYNLGYQILQMVMPLITAPYIARVLGSEGMGIYSYTHSVAYYFLIAGMLGVNTYGNRSIARVRDSQEVLNKEFSSIFQLQVFTSLLSIIVYVAYVSIVPLEYKWIYFIQLIYILSAVFDINWLFFGLEEFKITVLRKTIIKLATAAAVFLFVRTKSDLWIYTIIMAGGYFLGQCYLWFSIRKYVRYVRQPMRETFKHWKPMVILFAPTIATSVYRVMDKIMIGLLSSYEDVGLYEAADKIVIVCLGVVSAWGTIMLPRISNLFATGKLDQCKKYYVDSIELITFITSAMCFGLAAIANNFIPLFYGKGFDQSIDILKWLAISVLFIGISNTTRNQILIPMSREKGYLLSVTIGAVVNFFINLFLIQQIGVLGAVVGTICTEFVVAAIQVFWIRKSIPVGRTLLKTVPPMVIGLGMYEVVTWITEYIACSVVWTIALQVTIGALFFMVVTALYFKLTKRSVTQMVQSFK